MLQHLRIKNYALLEDLNIDFSEGLTILTGETGAGKSILIDAFGLLLGDRASTEVIRTGADSARVEGVFDIFGRADLRQILEDTGIETGEDHTVVITREISKTGRNRCFINGNPITLNVLRAIGDRLANLHSQHEHQSLFAVEIQRDYLDQFGHLMALREQVGIAYRAYQQAIRDVKQHQKRVEQMQSQIDIYEFQLNEIDNAGFYAGEEAELVQEEQFLENVETLYEHANNAYQTLYQGDGSLMNLAPTVHAALEKIGAIDPNMQEATEHAESLTVLIEELSLTLQKYLGKLEFDPQRMEEIRRRLAVIRGFKKRYRVSSVDELLAYADDLREKLENIKHNEDRLTELQAALTQAQKTYSALVIELSQKRQTTAETIQTRVETVLRELGMNARFQINVSQEAQSSGAVIHGNQTFTGDATGMDKIEFMLSANVGEDLAPLAKVASGGEISRTMLALKSVMAEIDPVPTFIFDEIDTGISGRIGEVVGEKLKALATSHQVICITHLPQIAAKGTVHFSVQKIESGGRTKTEIRRLNLEERIEEIAKIMGGETIREVTRQHARELLGM